MNKQLTYYFYVFDIFFKVFISLFVCLCKHILSKAHFRCSSVNCEEVLSLTLEKLTGSEENIQLVSPYCYCNILYAVYYL